MNHCSNHLTPHRAILHYRPLLVACLLILLLIAASQAVHAQEAVSASSPTTTEDDTFLPAAAPLVDIMAASIDIYAGPSRDHALAGQVAQGESYQIMDQITGCGWLQIGDGEIPLGWIEGHSNAINTDVVCGVGDGGMAVDTTVSTVDENAATATSTAESMPKISATTWAKVVNMVRHWVDRLL